MKFTDEKTQFLYENAISKFSYYSKCAKDDVRPRIMNQAIKYYDDAEAAFISHVEARLRREQEPCEWEKLVNFGDFWINGDGDLLVCDIHRAGKPREAFFQYCPMCGRKLD